MPVIYEDGEPVDVTFSFAELSDKAKERAREKLRTSSSYLGHEWWDYVYEDAVECGRLLGIEIGKKYHKTMNGREVGTPAIYFSGFCSQGDGASFEGSYSLPEDPMAVTRYAPLDETLKNLAERLVVLQTRVRLEHDGGIRADITADSSRYYHSSTMNIEIGMDDEERVDALDFAEIGEEITSIMREFADWIYERLEQEYDYLMSDECVDGYLEDLMFDDEGNEL